VALALLSVVASTALEAKAESTVQIMTAAEQKVYTADWKKLFKVPRKSACSRKNLLRRIRRELKDQGHLFGKDNRKRSKFYWVKQWGYESAAYFFDYLDPILRKDVVKEFNAIMKDLKAFPASDKKMPDPFDFKKLLAKGKGNVSKKQVKMLKKFTANYDAKTYEASANLPQVAAAMKKWKWNIDGEDPTFFTRFFTKYDMNFDGKLSPREFILASLWHNKQTVGTNICTHCYGDLGKSLDAMFLYLDCDNNGLLSAEEIWTNIPNINRKTQKWNIFAFGNNQSIRTAAINDFILKNQKTKEGFLTRSEFRVGMLLGFWDRQADTTKVFDKEERTMKRLRWREGDLIDIALYNYHKKLMIATKGKLKF